MIFVFSCYISFNIQQHIYFSFYFFVVQSAIWQNNIFFVKRKSAMHILVRVSRTDIGGGEEEVWSTWCKFCILFTIFHIPQGYNLLMLA